MKRLILLLTASLQASTITTFTFPPAIGLGGAHQEQIFEGALTTAYDSRTAKLIGPNGTTEVPRQPLYQKLAFPWHFPQTTPDSYFQIAAGGTCSSNATNDTIYIDHSKYNFRVGTAFYYTSSSPIGGTTTSTTYFVVAYNKFYNASTDGMDNAFQISTTPGGSPINITTTGNCAAGDRFTYTGFTVDGSTDTFSSPNHGFQVGDPFRCLGTGPSGITCDGTVAGYVISSGFTSSAFKLSATVGGSAIDVGTLASGLNRIVPSFTFTLVDTGAPTATVTNPVVVDASNANYYQITNGLTGFRVMKAGVSLTQNPIQGIELKDGTWVGTSSPSDLLKYSGGITTIAHYLDTSVDENAAYTVKFTDAGPLKTSVQVTYTGTHGDYYYNGVPLSGGGTAASTYTVNLTLLANSKAIGKKISGNLNAASFLNVYSPWPTTKPDYITTTTPQAPSCGFIGPFTITGATNANPTVLTIVNNGITSASNPGWTGTVAGVGGNTGANGTGLAITPVDSDHVSIAVDTSMGSMYTSGGTLTITAQSGLFTEAQTLNKLIGYSQEVNPSTACNSGERFSLASWYFYDQGGNAQWVSKRGGTSTDPALAIFQGHSSAQVNGGQNAVGWYSSDNRFGGAALAIFDVLMPCVACGSGSNLYTGNNVREYYIYSGSIADVTPTAGNQPTQMQLDMNAIVGINGTKLYQQQLDFADPVGGWKPAFIPDASFTTIRSNYIADSPSGYRAAMDASTGASGQQTLAMWLADSSAGITANAIVPNTNLAQSFMYALVHGFGTTDAQYAAVQGTYFTGPASVTLSNALADPNTTQGIIDELKALAAFFGCTIWDYDFVPADVVTDSSCTVNQCVQVTATRSRYVSTFPPQPQLATHLSAETSTAISLINTAINTYGAGTSGPHYFGAIIYDPYFTTLAQKKLGTFSPTLTPRLGRMQGWFNSATTPPEPRFGTNRRCAPTGDGVVEPCGTMGFNATMYDGVDTGISQQGVAAFFSQSTTTKFAYSDFFGWNGVAIDTTITNPGLDSPGSTNYSGWGSFLRQNWATAYENWVVIRNGTFCSDHCHYDNGAIVNASFLKNPWIMDPSMNIYDPPSSGAVMHSTFVADADYPAADWKSTLTSLILPGDWGTPVQTEMISLPHSAKATQVMTNGGTTWTREVTLANTNTAYPIMRTWDHRAGTNATDAGVFSYNQLASDAAINAPGGPIAAPVTIQPGFCSGGITYPSGFTSASIGSGLQHFGFTGLYWPTISNGIDVDVYLLRGNSMDEIGFQNLRHPCGSASQLTDYIAANTAPLTSFTRVDATHANIVMGSFRFLEGQRVRIRDVSGAGDPNVLATVDSVSGTTATISGVSGLTGSYTVVGATAAPSFMESYQWMRIHTTGDSVVHHLPYLKDAAPPRTVTSPSGTALRVVQGSETTNLSDTQLDWTNGTAKLATSYDANSHSVHGYTLTGGTQELYCSSATSCVWTVTGLVAGNRCVDPGVTMYADAPVTNPTGTTLCRYHNGADPTTGAPPVYTINLSTTLGTQSSVAVQSYSASGSLYLKAGTEFVGKVSSSGAATITTVTPSSHSAFSLCADASGSLVCE